MWKANVKCSPKYKIETEYFTDSFFFFVIYGFITSDPQLTQTQLLSLKLTLTQT